MEKTGYGKGGLAVSIAFFVSGFPALTYQIVWQRSLFTIYGVNIESITVVVSAFMLGLGLGALLGGRLSRSPRVPALALFGLAELTIGAFGLFSLRLFGWAGRATLGAPTGMTGAVTFSLLLLPTLMMGATLPLLVAHLVRASSNVGRSTGTLYFVNTMGSAFASITAAFFLMKTLGKQGSVDAAAALNLLVGVSALIMYMRSRGAPSAAAAGVEQPGGRKDFVPAVSFPSALAVACVSGFIALSYEIVWIRAYSIGLSDSAATFAVVLGMYLAGIALGSALAKRHCPDGTRGGAEAARVLAWFVAAANIAGFLLVPLAARAFQTGSPAAPLVMIIPAAAGLGAVLPLVSHTSIPPDGRAGSRLGFLYMASIAGSVAGTLVTGFVLMDVWPLQRTAVFLALTGLAMAAALVLSSGVGRKRPYAAIAVLAVIGVACAAGAGTLYDRLYERLTFKTALADGTRFAYVREGRSGVVTVTQNGTVYGEGVYDGSFNTDIVHDTNLVLRAYSVNAFHRQPGDILMIGLSSGSWAQVLANNPKVERLTIVEINPAYIGIINEFPEVKSLLDNPRVDIAIDDGRRWLSANPGRRFDMIIMNTTWHWRAFATNLLSREFLGLCREHLKPGGVLCYNTTFSPAADRTGAVTFPYAYKYINLMVVSDSPIKPDKAGLVSTLKDYVIDGRRMLDTERADDRARLAEIEAIFDSVDQDRPWYASLESRGHILARTKGQPVITDDNMVTEWRRL